MTHTMTHTMTPIALCADDYAQHAGIDEGICNLLALGRLSAVSCFSTAPAWPAAATELLPYLEQADIGLHFNLTEGFGCTATPGLQAVILRSLLRRISPVRLERVLERQLDAFEDGLGRAPDFIDGHQHVHQLPGVRSVLLKVMQRRYPDHPLWVRTTVPADSAWRGKPQILKLLGGAALARDLQSAGVRSNHGFAGVYGFDRADYDVCFQGWLKVARPGMLIMCHPATEPYADDAIAEQRVIEYRFLSSTQCGQMLSDAHVKLTRLTGIVAAQ